MDKKVCTLEDLVKKSVENNAVTDLMALVREYMIDVGCQPYEFPIITQATVLLPVHCTRDYKEGTMVVEYATMNKNSILEVYTVICDMVDADDFFMDYCNMD